MKHHLNLGLTAAIALSVVGCAGGLGGMQMGSQRAKTVSTGAAAGGTTVNANDQLEHCDSALGTISLVENESAGWYTILRNEYQLPPTAQLLRLLIQQSNCFIVVERGAAGMRAMERERALMGAGEMRSGSNMGGGQVVASDYSLQPEVIFSQSDTGGVGGALGGRSRGGNILGAILANTQTRESSVILLMVDNRSGVQVSVSEGSASKTDWGGMGSIFGSRTGGALSGYQRTPQGKVIAAAFMDAYNQMVVALRNYQAQYVQGQGLGGGGRLSVDGAVAPSQTGVATAAPMLSLRDAQTRLNQLGYDAGTADGIMGNRTANALRTFQSDHNLPITGRLDAATSQALRQ